MGVSEHLTVAAPSFPVWSVDAGSAQGILYEDSFLLCSARGEEVRGHPPSPHTHTPSGLRLPQTPLETPGPVQPPWRLSPPSSLLPKPGTRGSFYLPTSGSSGKANQAEESGLGAGWCLERDQK